jgi:tetraprenyl-beta-curcumene synthase
VGSARETASAAGALAAYLTTVLPRLRGELRRWGPLPEGKATNAEAVAVFAILAPRHARAGVVRAIAALQIAIDHRDAIEESAGSFDSAHLERLETRWRAEVAALPACAAVLPLLERAVERCEEGQRRTHATAAGDVAALRGWALSLPAPTGYRWWEVAAAASSSVAAHALIAAAADPRTTAQSAALIEAAYHPSIGALTVLLDDLVDRESDAASGEHSYIDYYSGSEAAERIEAMVETAAAGTQALPRSRRHLAILDGIVAFYLSAQPPAGSNLQLVRTRLLSGLNPSLRLLNAFMRLRAI